MRESWQLFSTPMKEQEMNTEMHKNNCTSQFLKLDKVMHKNWETVGLFWW